MKMPRIPKGAIRAAWKTFMKKAEDNLPTILHCVAVVAGFAATGFAIKSTPKANVDIQTKKADKVMARLAASPQAFPSKESIDRAILDEKLTAWEWGEVILKNYWPTGLCLSVMTGLTAYAEVMHIKHIAALTAGIALVEKDNKDLVDKIKEIGGQKKLDEAQKEVAKDAFLNIPDEKYIVQTTHGHTLFYEPNSRTYFYSSIDAVKKAIQDFREKLRVTGDQSVEDLCYYLDIPLEDPYIENHLVWTYLGDFSGGTQLLDINIDYIGHPVTGEPCAALLFSDRPTWGQ